jgi:solute carrier family 25 carnitine/acylcarnitine transporter 20/29
MTSTEQELDSSNSMGSMTEIISKQMSPFPSITHELTAATVGGITASIVGHPLDTIKVKLQTQTYQAPKTARFHSGFDCFLSVIRNDGVRALYYGLKPPLYACVFYNAITFGSLGYFKRWIASFSDNDSHCFEATREATVMQNAMAGALTGLCLSVIQTPVDQIKTQLQIQTSMNVDIQKTAYKSPSTLLYHIYRNECASNLNQLRKKLMRAYPASFVREFYGSAVYFGIYAYLKQALGRIWIPNGQNRRKLSSYDYMVAGSLSGLSYWLAVYPVDVVKSRMHAAPSKIYNGTFQGIHQIWKQEGSRALFFGMQTTILRSLFTSGVMFMCYEKTLEFLKRID